MMKKLVISIVVLAVLAVALVSAGYVFAQTPTPQAPVPGSGFGPGMMGGRGYRGGMMGGSNWAGAQSGFMHDEMIDAFSQKLGISVDELNGRLANGETMAQIAYSKGLSVDQFSNLMTEARSQAIDQAVKEGDLTQDQANWMKQHGPGQMGGGRGNGQGRFGNPACPYYQTNP
jgi:hypothetical protein